MPSIRCAETYLESCELPRLIPEHCSGIQVAELPPVLITIARRHSRKIRQAQGIVWEEHLGAHYSKTGILHRVHLSLGYVTEHLFSPWGAGACLE